MHKLGPHDFGENDSGILWNPCTGTFGSRTFDWQLAKHTQDEIWRGTLQAKVRVALVHRLQFGPVVVRYVLCRTTTQAGEETSRACEKHKTIRRDGLTTRLRRPGVIAPNIRCLEVQLRLK